MSDKDTKEKSKEETRTQGPQGCAEMCGQVMSGGMPDCCGPQMREKMSQWMAGCQAKGEE